MKALPLCLLLLAACTAKPPPAPSTPPEPAPAAVPGEALLKLAHRCVAELYPDGKGVGGNKLRFDSLSLRPHAWRFVQDGPLYTLPAPTTTGWYVRVEEEQPHKSIPDGVDFSIDPHSKTCGRLPMD